MRRLMLDWDVILVILAVGLLTGLITFMAEYPHPVQACHALAVHAPHLPVRWVCAHP